jgi:ferredoxin
MGALLDGRDKPQLNFIEDLCVQCGMCDKACPEDAVLLKPRYLFDREQARKPRLLNEEPVFHCISCNKPFATQKMIDTMSAKLKDHPMFQGAAFERLKMCEDCRVKAMF